MDVEDINKSIESNLVQIKESVNNSSSFRLLLSDFIANNEDSPLYGIIKSRNNNLANLNKIESQLADLSLLKSVNNNLQTSISLIENGSFKDSAAILSKSKNDLSTLASLDLPLTSKLFAKLQSVQRFYSVSLSNLFSQFFDFSENELLIFTFIDLNDNTYTQTNYLSSVSSSELNKITSDFRALLLSSLDPLFNKNAILTDEKDGLSYSYSDAMSVKTLLASLSLWVVYINQNIDSQLHSILPDMSKRIISRLLETLPDFTDQQFLPELSELDNLLHSLNWTVSSKLSKWIEDFPTIALSAQVAKSLKALRDDLLKFTTLDLTVVSIQAENNQMHTSAAVLNDPTSEIPATEPSHNALQQTEVSLKPKLAKLEDNLAPLDDAENDEWDWDDDFLDDPIPSEPTEQPHEPTPDESIFQEETQSSELPPDDDNLDDWEWDDTVIEGLDSPGNSPAKTRNELPPLNETIPLSSAQTTFQNASLSISNRPEKVLASIQTLMSKRSSENSSKLASAAASFVSLFCALSALSPTSDDSRYKSVVYNDCIYLSQEIPKRFIELPESIPTELLEFAQSQMDEIVYNICVECCKYAEAANYFTSPSQQASNCEEAIIQFLSLINGMNQDLQLLLPETRLKVLGDLINRIVTLIISWIEDSTLISEKDSGVLASYIRDFASIENLFPQMENTTQVTDTYEEDEGPPQYMIALYCPQWLKFQYLAEILDSNMADMTFMVRNGSLVDYSKAELVNLVLALFADCENRNKLLEVIQNEHNEAV
ncbi:hypothetical protein CANCADRAFT_480 [Tortispora caseinolytica NRRL Y-17796]|uniref:ZW10 C-terminal helical domain-containing protein n=1 Tax=Tortispora caseinolytica NRRL Y-17796 TaxID=767744 RepID=A0A1E4TJG8_9ASCO|nr:hypothetical protein CANCADRAFT_480 [Tortispora caseinolytica NRRL Y-17796]